MRVQLDPDLFYATQDDPWGIGDADSERYDLYRESLLAHAADRRSILDIGSGFGAFLARFRDDFEASFAIEVAVEAVERGRERFGWIEFERGSADALETTAADGRRFSAIVYSDVINYLDFDGKKRSLDWIARHLEPDGVALIAAYSPGGRYLTASELRGLVRTRFAILEERVLESEHAMFIVRAKRTYVALTVDHETWQPIPAGRQIDFQRDVLGPTAALLDACDASGAKLTLFAELGEYLWLEENDPATAARIAEQWRDAVRRGHDVQLHLHPNWLPETGARRAGEEWIWDWSVRKADDYPGDLEGLIARCCRTLERELHPVQPDYRVTCFRAGAYEAQPFELLHDALAANGITCDSSVYAGGQRDDRTYDYTLAYSDGQPYFASRYDPQLKAPPAERALVELPILSPAPNERWTFDFTEAERFALVLEDRMRTRGAGPSDPQSQRRLDRARGYANWAYWLLRRHRRAVNRVLPRRLAHSLTAYPPEELAQDDYCVLVGHSKADLDIDAIAAGLGRLRDEVTFVTLSDMAARARADAGRAVSSSSDQEAAWQVRRERSAVLGAERNEAQSFLLQRRMPPDRHRILDLGCGAGDWSARLAQRMPWAEVTGVDVGEEFIAHARNRHRDSNVSFAVADFARLPFADGTFDAIYADNSLEHAWDVDATLREAFRVTAGGGVLVAALPSDAHNPRRVCDNHTWKTAEHDVRLRLEAAGFVDIEVDEVETFRRLGMPPYPPSFDRMLYVTAWRRDRSCPPDERARQLSRFVYERIDPGAEHWGVDQSSILADGHAWCTGYAVAAGGVLRDAGFDVRWCTLLGDGPPPTGTAPIDAHEVVEVGFPDGERRVLDPMANVWYDATLADLLADPSRADPARDRDGRYEQRGYDAYATSAWYRRVARVAVRRDPRDVQEFLPAAAVAANGHPAGGPAWRRRALRARARARAVLDRYVR